MNTISGGAVVKGKQEVYERSEKRTISLSFARINEIVGTPIEQHQVISALKSIDVFVLEEAQGKITVSIPPFRHDIVEYADLIEEVARIYGYDRIPATMPVITVQPPKISDAERYGAKVKEYLIAAGFYELINFSFCGLADIANFLLPPTDERASHVPS